MRLLAIPTGGKLPETRGHKAPRILSGHLFYLVCILVSLALFFTPIIGWTGLSSHRMNLGGDNSLLYFPFPLQWIEHYSLSPVSQNLSGYNPTPQYLPISGVFYLLDLARLNSEGVYFGSVLAGLFLGTTLLVREIGNLAFKARPSLVNSGAFFAGIIAVSSPLVAQTQWTAILPGLMCEMLLPWTLLLFLRHQLSGGWRRVFAAGILWILGSAAINDAPSSIGAATGGLILAAVLFASGLWKPAWRRAIEFLTSLTMVQLFWIVPFVLTFKYGEGVGAVSGSGKNSALTLLHALAPYQSAADALALRQSTAMMKAFAWPQLAFNHWSEMFNYVGYLPWIVIVIAFAIALRRDLDSVSRLVMFTTVGSVMALILFCPNIWGIRYHVSALLTEIVPGWVAERNFYVTLGFPYAEVVSVSAGIAFSYIFSFIKVELLRNILVAVGAAALLAYNAPFFMGAYFRLPYSGTIPFTRVLPNGLPRSYLSIIRALQQLPPGGVLSLPLTNSGWTIVTDHRTLAPGSGLYIGTSPVFALTGRPDYNSTFGFDNPINPELGREVTSMLSSGNVAGFVFLMRQLGVRYVIQNSADLGKHDFLGMGVVSNPVLEAHETSEIAQLLAPHVVATDGPYQLREVSGANDFPVSLLSSTANNIKPGFVKETYLGFPLHSPTECGEWNSAATVRNSTSIYVRLTRRASYQSSRACVLVIEDLYSPKWVAKLMYSGHTELLHPISHPVTGYFTAFQLPAITSQSAMLMISYSGQQIVWLPLGLSSVSACALLVLTIEEDWIRRRRTILRGWPKATSKKKVKWHARPSSPDLEL